MLLRISFLYFFPLTVRFPLTSSFTDSSRLFSQGHEMTVVFLDLILLHRQAEEAASPVVTIEEKESSFLPKALTAHLLTLTGSSLFACTSPIQ